MSFKVIIAIFFCGIYVCSAMPKAKPTVTQHIYLPGDDEDNWKDTWKAINASSAGRGGASANVSIMDTIIEINAKERGSGVHRSGDNKFLFEGDIDIDKNEAIKIIRGQSRRRRAVMKSRNNLWPRNVPYAIDNSLLRVQTNVRNGIRAWEAALPCMGRWNDVTRKSKPRDYMYFFRGGGCYSQVGRVGGAQRVSIGSGCEHIGVVVHEIGHAMGLWHEQSRPDRDSYVRINWNNIIPAMKFNFQKYTTARINSLGVPYDYDSVMHYGAYAFTRYRGTPTIQSIQGNRRLGQRNGLSSKDIKQAQLLYRCTTTKPVTKPPPSGCQDVQTARNCIYWKQLNYCVKTYVDFMKKNCCKTCGPPCKDKQTATNCNHWKGQGFCRNGSRYASYMKKNCCKTCAV